MIKYFKLIEVIMSTIPNPIAFWRPAINYNDNRRLEADQTSINIRIATVTAIATSIALRSLGRISTYSY